MTGQLHRLVGAVLALACLASPALGQSRPLRVDDIVALEAFGRASIAPDGRWAVYEKRGAYDTAPRFDFAQRSVWAIMDLWLVDLSRPNVGPTRLLPGEGPGLLRGPWSPSGRRLLVQRFQNGRFEFGVVTLADRSVQWTGLTPEIAPTGSTSEWISEDQIALMVRPDGSLPALLRYYEGSQARMADAWARTRQGREPSRTVVETREGVATTEAPDPLQALVMLDLASGVRRTLVQGRISDFAVSPDARRIAVIEGAERRGIRPDAIDQQDAPNRQRIALIALGDGAVVRPMPGLDVAPHLLRWSADSGRLLVWARRDDLDWTDGQLMQVDRDGAAVVDRGSLTPGAGDDILRGVRAEWLGETPVLYAHGPGTERFDWHALVPGGPPTSLTGTLGTVPSRIAALADDGLHLFADNAVWAVDLSGVRRVGPRDLTLSEVMISDPDKPMRLKSNDAPRQAWSAAFGPERETFVITGSGTARRLGPAASGDTRVVASSSQAALVLDRVELVETLSLRTEDGVHTLDQVNAGRADVALSRPVPVIHPDALGRETRSWLFLPQGGGPESIRGLVVQVYPGSVDTGVWSGPLTLTYGLRAAVLAGAGFAVLTPSIPIDAPGTTTTGFYVRSVDAAVDAALAAYPELPRDRIAILGHSFGGHAALAIATGSTRYQSYIAASGMSDWFGEWGEFIPATRILPEDGFMMMTQQGYTEAGQGALSAPPWTDPAAYVERSPYLAADRITAPVMLVTADKDFVPMSQSERMFSALYRQGRTARLVTYWGEHHQLWSPANIQDLYGQVFDWLDRTLGIPIAVSPLTDDAPTPAPSPRTPPPR